MESGITPIAESFPTRRNWCGTVVPICVDLCHLRADSSGEFRPQSTQITRIEAESSAAKRRKRHKQEQRRPAAKVTRRLALLHAHGWIAQVARTPRGIVSKKGRRMLRALRAARHATTEQWMTPAA